MTKETKDLGAAPPHSTFQEWAMAAGRAAILMKGSTAQLRVLTEAMAAAYARGRRDGLLEAAGQVGSLPSAAARIRALAGSSDKPAAGPTDSSAALLEARRLLGEAQLYVARHVLYGDAHDLLTEIRAFLRSDSERSEPARSESGGSNSVDAPTKEER